MVAPIASDCGQSGSLKLSGSNNAQTVISAGGGALDPGDPAEGSGASLEPLPNQRDGMQVDYTGGCIISLAPCCWRAADLGGGHVHDVVECDVHHGACLQRHSLLAYSCSRDSP